MAKEIIETSGLTAFSNITGNEKIPAISADGASIGALTPAQMNALFNRSASEVTSPASSLFVKVCDANGNEQKVSIANLAAVVSGVGSLKSSYDNVFVMFHRNIDNYPLMVKPDKWTSYQNSGEIAEGVVVVEGGKILVVSPTETALTWSSAAVSGGGVITSDRITAMNDWAGKANTASQITHAECSSASYAPGFCAAYSRVNANGKGLTAGRWWLPSLGELFCIYANMRKINYALSLIKGATQLTETWYWSSTECSAAAAWTLGLGDGAAGSPTKATGAGRVRPVSAFLQ